MRIQRFLSVLTVMLCMVALLLCAEVPFVSALDVQTQTEDTQVSQDFLVSIRTDESATDDVPTSETATHETGEEPTTDEEFPYIIVENTTADPNATTAPTEIPTEAVEFATDENGEVVTDENGENVTVPATQEYATDENGETVTDENGEAVTEQPTEEAPTEEPTQPPLPDAISENGLLLTLASADADYGYRIVIADDCSNEVGYAAGLLQNTVQQMTGVLLPIVSDGTEKAEREICLGETNRTKKTPAGVSDNGFAIFAQGEKVFLYTVGTHGAVHAVSAFLHEVCGINRFAQDQTQFPDTQTLTVPADLSLQRGQYFSYTETRLTENDASFLQMNGLTGGAYTAVSEDGSTALTYLTPCEDTLGTLFVSAETWFETHPEYFALYNGERNPAQLCLSDWSVYSLVMEQIEDILRSEWAPNKKQQVICLSLPDNDVICQCGQCAALTEQNGSYAGVLLAFLNRISAGLYAAGYSNLQLETTARGTVFTVPTALTPAHNITVRVFSDARCFSHPLTQGNCAHNRYFVEMLKLWCNLASTVYVDIPTENTAATIAVFPNLQYMQGDLQTLYYLGVDGVCAADDPRSAECGSELRALRIYLLTRLFADPYCNLFAERRAFLKSWYGDGYEQIEQFIDLICSHAGDADGHLFIDTAPENCLQLTAEQIEKADRLWITALAGCNDGRQLLHAEQSRIAWRFWEACCAVGDFHEDAEISVMQELIDELKTAGVSRYSVENEVLNLSFTARTLRPQQWNTPALTLLKPHFDLIYAVCSRLVLTALLCLFVFVLIRRRPFFLLPLWASVVLALLLPWHKESYLAAEWPAAVLTGILWMLYPVLLCAFAMYAKYSCGTRTQWSQIFGMLKKTVQAFKTKDVQENAVSEPNEDSRIRLSARQRRNVVFAALVGAVTAFVPYFAVLAQSINGAYPADQTAPLAYVFPAVQTCVCAVILCVRFIRNSK